MEAVVYDIPEVEEIEVTLPGKIQGYEEWRSNLTTRQKTEKGDEFPFYVEYVFTEFLKGCGINAEQTPDAKDAPGGGDTRVWLASHNRYLYFDTKLRSNVDVDHEWTSKYCVNVSLGKNTVLKIASGHRESQQKLLDEVLDIELELDTNKNMEMIKQTTQAIH